MSPAEKSTGKEAKVTGPRSYFPSIETKYGKPIDEWMALLPTAGTTKHMEFVAWLKDEHGMGHGHANALVAVYLKPGVESGVLDRPDADGDGRFTSDVLH